MILNPLRNLSAPAPCMLLPFPFFFVVRQGCSHHVRAPSTYKLAAGQSLLLPATIAAYCWPVTCKYVSSVLTGNPISRNPVVGCSFPFHMIVSPMSRTRKMGRCKEKNVLILPKNRFLTLLASTHIVGILFFLVQAGVHTNLV